MVFDEPDAPLTSTVMSSIDVVTIMACLFASHAMFALALKRPAPREASAVAY